ncbi:transposable element Tcb1 transposase [Trichonephila clavipes]|nr:transposable element Tcb1 transposase [Trichonephila clavipes]
MMVWGAIGYMSLSPLVHIDGTLNSACYISGVLRCMVLPFFRVQQNPTFKQDNAQLHVASIVRTFHDMENL